MSETTTAERPMRRVRTWIAALLSFLWPGLGQFYAGRTGRALAWVALYFILTAAILIGLHFFEVNAWLALLPVLLLFMVIAASDAFIAASARRSVPRRGPVRLLGYVAVFAAVIGIGEANRALLPLHSFYVPSESMLPTIAAGDRVLVRMYSPLCSPPSPVRGDVVVIRVGRELLVRRIVGVPGDRVRVDGQGLTVNGERATGEVQGTIERVDVRGGTVVNRWAEERLGAAGPWRVYERPALAWGPDYDGVVPEGHVFTLGDNRANSNDDRINGPTPVANLAGRALRIAFSLANESFAFPWRDLRVHPGPSCASS